MSGSNVFSRIVEEYYKFTASEKKVSDYISGQRKNVQYMSISELAEACDVAEATISRFCRRLGYKGYNAFKLAIANASENEKTVDQLNENSTLADIAVNRSNVNINAIEQTLALINTEAVEKAAQLMLNSQKVLCMGQGGSAIIAEEAAHLFSMAFSNFTPIVESHMQMIAAAGLSEKDCVLYFSYSGSTQDVADSISVAKSRNAKVILVTRFPKSPGAMQADVVLLCGAKESPLQHGSVEARIPQLYLLDVLYHQMCAMDPVNVEKHKNNVAEAVALKHI